MRSMKKVLVFCVCLIPFLVLLFRVVQNDLGPDPAQELAKETGEWALRFLVFALAVSPLRQLTGKAEIVRYRRMIGLFAFFYATVHLSVWMTFLLEFRWGAILEELLERPFITVGFAAYLILFALAVTSSKAMVRRMGRNWKRLHRFVYLASILAVVHLLWILRTDVGEAVFYGAIVGVLLCYRFYRRAVAKRV